MTEEEYAEILRIVRELKNSPAMNGEFVKLTESVEHIRSTQGKMCTDVSLVVVHQKEARAKVEDIHVALYHPDNGIYRRLTDAITVDNGQNEHSAAIEKKQEALDGSMEEHDDRISSCETLKTDLHIVGGERLEHLDSVVKLDKNTRKLFWAVAFGLGAFLLKEFGPVLLALL